MKEKEGGQCGRISSVQDLYPPLDHRDIYIYIYIPPPAQETTVLQPYRCTCIREGGISRPPPPGRSEHPNSGPPPFPSFLPFSQGPRVLITGHSSGLIDGHPARHLGVYQRKRLLAGGFADIRFFPHRHIHVLPFCPVSLS